MRVVSCGNDRLQKRPVVFYGFCFFCGDFFVLRCLFLFILICSVGVAQDAAPLRTFEQTLGDIQSSSNEFQSTQDQIESVKLDFASRELALETRIEASAEKLQDERQTLAPFIRREAKSFSLGFIQPLSTGTLLSFTPTLDILKANSLTAAKQHNLGWEFAVTQSLWKDFFGRSTRLRRTRESYQRQQQLAEAYLRQGQMIYNFEFLYWDLALSQKELELRKKNYDMSREIYTWVKDRQKKSAAEKSDALQAEALVTSRELMWLVAQDRNRQLKIQMEKYLPQQHWSLQLNDLTHERDIQSLSVQWPTEEFIQPYKLELLQLRGLAGASSVVADEQKEALRPDLNLKIAYAKNAINPNFSDAEEAIFKNDHKAITVGLTFKTGLNFSLQNKKIDAANLMNQSYNKRLSALESDALVSWQDLQNEITNLKQRISRAEQLLKTQLQKAKEERRRYSMGRTTAFQAITFEQEAADAELMLWTLYSTLRKSESKARLYAR